jgi:4-hydroxy-tetrahydrodipicolinate synthase
MFKCRGVYTALVTPFDDRAATVDLERLAANVRLQVAGGVTGVVPCGTTGEAPTLIDAEHRAVVETTLEQAQSAGLQVVAGAGSNSTAHAVELHCFAGEAGCDASLQVSPYYNKPTQEGLYRHFSTIADACDLPIVLYNIPGRTAVGMTIDLIQRLAGHPNIVAIKEASGSLDFASEIATTTDLVLLSGDDSLTLPMAAVGGAGVVSVLSNLCPDRVQALCAAFLDGDMDGARDLHWMLLPLAQGLLGLATNPIPVKAALAHLGLDTGALRLPLVSAGPDTRRTVAELLNEAGLRRAELAPQSS